MPHFTVSLYNGNMCICEYPTLLDAKMAALADNGKLNVKSVTESTDEEIRWYLAMQEEK